MATFSARRGGAFVPRVLTAPTTPQEKLGKRTAGAVISVWGRNTFRRHVMRLTKFVIAFVLLLTSARLSLLADDTPDTPKQQLDKLLEAYKEYGLPLPPADAKLVRYEAWPASVENGNPEPASYALAFLI